MEYIDAVRNLSVSHIRVQKDDDFFVDRLHHRYTVAALVLFFLAVTTNQYIGDPINCWVPAQFTSSFESYTNRLCWLQNTYFIEDQNDIPDNPDERYKSMLKYYQWVHLIILFQTMLFVLPRVLWRSLNDKCGIEIVNYVDAAMKYETVDQFNKREDIMEFLSGHISTFIRAKEQNKSESAKLRYKCRRFISYLLFWTGKRFGNYLVILFLFVKFLYLVNVFGQLFLMTYLLGINNYHLLGFEILNRMAKGYDMVRELGTDHQYTVQCVLTINIFTEKIYVILWFWFVILTGLTLFDLIMYISKNCFAITRHQYVKKHVRVFYKTDDQNQDEKNIEDEMLYKFSTVYLKPDVIFVFQILATNVNGMVVSELVRRLWTAFQKEEQIRRNEAIRNTNERATNDSELDSEDQYKDPLISNPAINETSRPAGPNFKERKSSNPDNVQKRNAFGLLNRPPVQV